MKRPLPDLLPSSRDGPVKLEQEYDQLFEDAYPEKEMRLSIKTTIERHLDYLNERGDYDRAREFLRTELHEAHVTAKRLDVARRRASFRNVLRSVVPFTLIAYKAIRGYLGL